MSTVIAAAVAVTVAAAVAAVAITIVELGSGDMDNIRDSCGFDADIRKELGTRTGRSDDYLNEESDCILSFVPTLIETLFRQVKEDLERPNLITGICFGDAHHLLSDQSTVVAVAATVTTVELGSGNRDNVRDGSGFDADL
ncbi:unnamed protein product [Camellia sinensis]